MGNIVVLYCASHPCGHSRMTTLEWIIVGGLGLMVILMVCWLIWAITHD